MFTFIIPIIAIVRFILQATVYKDGAIYGYMVGIEKYKTISK